MLTTIMGLLSVTISAGAMQEAILKVNPGLTRGQAAYYESMIKRYAVRYDLDPKLLAAVIATESRFKEDAKGPIGEIGLMQLRPQFHATYVEDINDRVSYLFDVDNNIAIGAKYLSGLKTVFVAIYSDYRFVEHYNRGPNCNPKKFPYYGKVMQFYRVFNGGDIEESRKLVQRNKTKSRANRQIAGT